MLNDTLEICKIYKVEKSIEQPVFFNIFKEERGKGNLQINKVINYKYSIWALFTFWLEQANRFFNGKI